MNPTIAQQIDAQLKAAKGPFPQMQPDQALSLIRTVSALKGAIKQGNFIPEIHEGQTAEEAQAELGSDLEVLGGFILELQIASSTPWHELG
jgi:hypothetical protein